MKKIVLLTILLLFSFSTSTFAKPNAADLNAVKQLSTKIAGEQKAYNPTSIRLLNTNTFTAQIKDKDNKTQDITVRALYAEYKLINDKIFSKTHKDVYFYDETNKAFLDQATIDMIPAAKEFKEQYKGEIGTKVHYTGPLIILTAIGILIFFVLRYAERNFYLSSPPREV
ncbi:MAG: hypothetical protein ACI35O_14620 [Bacillaceae bacterium]